MRRRPRCIEERGKKHSLRFSLLFIYASDRSASKTISITIPKG